MITLCVNDIILHIPYVYNNICPCKREYVLYMCIYVKPWQIINYIHFIFFVFCTPLIIHNTCNSIFTPVNNYDWYQRIIVTFSWHYLAGSTRIIMSIVIVSHNKSNNYRNFIAFNYIEMETRPNKKLLNII